MEYAKKPKGVIVPMVSPFTAEDSIDTNAVQKIVRYHAKSGVSLFIMGTTGEGLSISNKERIRLARAVIEENQGQSNCICRNLSSVNSQIYQKNRNLSQSFAALKVMMAHIDLCDPFVLPPLIPCTHEEQEEVISNMASCNQLDPLKQK